MTTYALTIGENGVESRAYEPGHAAQSFAKERNGDGSYSLRNSYNSNWYLQGNSNGVVTSAPRADDQRQSIEFHSGGGEMVQIKFGYLNLWLQITPYDVKAVNWDGNNQYLNIRQRELGGGNYAYTIDA